MSRTKFIFHIHTKYSHDSTISVDRLINFCRKNGVKVLGICDHNTIKGAKEAVRKSVGDPKIIICEEISTTSGEVIGMFLKDEIAPKKDLKTTISEIKSQGGLVCVPHPGERLRRSAINKEIIDEHRNEIDCIEIFNSRTIFDKDNQWASEYAFRYNIPPLYGSDSHNMAELSNSIIEIDEFTDSKNFLESCKNLSVITSGHTGLFWQIVSKIVKIVRRLVRFNE